MTDTKTIAIKLFSIVLNFIIISMLTNWWMYSFMNSIVFYKFNLLFLILFIVKNIAFLIVIGFITLVTVDQVSRLCNKIDN